MCTCCLIFTTRSCICAPDEYKTVGVSEPANAASNHHHHAAFFGANFKGTFFMTVTERSPQLTSSTSAACSGVR